MIDRSIGTKILMVVGLAALLSMVGLILFYTHSQRAIVVNEHKLVTDRMVATVVAGLGVIMETGKASIAQHYAGDIKAALDLEDFRFVRLNGEEAFLDNATIRKVNEHHGAALFQERSEISRNQLYQPDDPIFIGIKARAETHRIIDDDRRQYRTLAPIVNQAQCQHCHGSDSKILGFAQLTTSMRHVEQTIAESRNWAILVLLVVLLLFLFTTYLLLHNVVISPLRRVTSAMQRVEQGNLNQQVPELSRDELGHMARSFNRMTEKLLETYTGLESEQDKLTTIILNAGEGIVVTDKESRIMLVNPSAEQLIGKPVSEIVSQGFELLVDDPQMIDRLLQHPDPNYVECAHLGDRYLSVMAASIHTEQRGMLGKTALIRDVTEQKRREAYLEAISFKDELTGLLNRRSLSDVLSQSVADANERHRPLTFLMLDMDHFKQLNDNYGHAMGDRMLKAFGSFLSQRLRDSDYACRYGGEEFSVILTGTGVEGAFKTAEDIRRAVSEITIDGVSITISIGVASLEQCREATVNCLVEAADSALYLAKQRGRNRTVVYRATASEVLRPAHG
ncbi:MAG: diguanylate cyclase [Candidatus Thiodiazotropha lotti]|nr:diguanylate cyclase [Candidatus Thiodiazotropha lotti]